MCLYGAYIIFQEPMLGQSRSLVLCYLMQQLQETLISSPCSWTTGQIPTFLFTVGTCQFIVWHTMDTDCKEHQNSLSHFPDKFPTNIQF